jgi:acyl carrier protein
LAPDKIDPRQSFVHYRLDSLTAVELSGEIGEWLEQSVSPILIYDFPTPVALARHLAVEHTSSSGFATPSKVLESKSFEKNEDLLRSVEQFSDIEIETDIIRELDAIEQLMQGNQK